MADKSRERRFTVGPDRKQMSESELPPAMREAIAAKDAERRDPAFRERLARERAAIEKEFPPADATPELIDIGAALRVERERQGLSLTDVYERTGITRGQVSNVETGKVPNPTIATLREIARALGKSIEIRLVDEEWPMRWVKVDSERLAGIINETSWSGYFARCCVTGGDIAPGDRVTFHDVTGKSAVVQVVDAKTVVEECFIKWAPVAAEVTS